MTTTDEVLESNARYAESFDKGSLPLPPARGLAVVACMDARLDTHKLLGLDEGDAHVIRNAGGVVSDDVIRSLVISQRPAGHTRDSANPPHRLRHADLPRRRRQGHNRGRYGASAGVRAGSVRRLGTGCATVDFTHPGQPFHPPEGPGSGLRIRLRHRPALTRSPPPEPGGVACTSPRPMWIPVSGARGHPLLAQKTTAWG